MVVFNTCLNQFGRKYIVKNPGENERELLLTWQKEYDRTLGEIIEQLLLFDKVSIKVYGENLPMVVLINELGVQQFEELIEEGVIEFILWTPMLTTLESEDLIGKAMPLQSGNLNSPVHADPAESVREGFKRMKVIPDRKIRRSLERKLQKVYKIPRDRFVHDAADIVMSAYTTRKLETAGMKKEKDIQYLDHSERMKLLKLGEGILETGILAEYQYSGFGNYQYYDISRQAFEAIQSAPGVVKGANEIFRTEILPDVPQLITEKKISLKDIVQLRRRRTSQKFREWLVNNGTNDEGYTTKQYIDEITNHKGVFETNKGKFIKTMGMYGIGAGLGGLAGGIPGTVLGMTAGSLLQPVSDIGLGLLDTYLLDGLLKGWQPKLFINEYQKIVQKHNNAS